MMETTIQFKFRLAQTAIGVRCCLAHTRYYCRDYLLPDSEPTDFDICITEADIAAERAYLLSKKTGNEPLEASTVEALEILVLCRKAAEVLPDYGAMLFHGSALAFDGSGVLFTATSGTGKSTHTALWRKVFGERVQMVNDDKPFLLFAADGVFVQGSPWRGKHRLGSNVAAPIKAICILNRGEDNRVERISAREALPVLMQQSYQPKSPEMLLQTIKLVSRLSAEVPIYRLFCNMEEEAARVAQQGILPDNEENYQ